MHFSVRNSLNRTVAILSPLTDFAVKVLFGSSMSSWKVKYALPMYTWFFFCSSSKSQTSILKGLFGSLAQPTLEGIVISSNSGFRLSALNSEKQTSVQESLSIFLRSEGIFGQLSD